MKRGQRRWRDEKGADSSLQGRLEASKEIRVCVWGGEGGG
jgi:hypothetical protein